MNSRRHFPPKYLNQPIQSLTLPLPPKQIIATPITTNNLDILTKNSAHNTCLKLTTSRYHSYYIILKMPTTTRNSKTLPKTMASTGLTQEEYNHLRRYLRTVLVPGSAGFDGYGIGMQNKDQFLEWFQALVSEIGPIYWPPGRSGRLSWPVDRAALVFLFSFYVFCSF